MFKIQLSYTEILFQNNRYLPKFISLSKFDNIEDILIYFYIYYDLILFTDDYLISLSLIEAKNKQDDHKFENDNIKYHHMLIQDIINNGYVTDEKKEQKEVYPEATQADIENMLLAYSTNNVEYSRRATDKDTVEVFKSYYEREIEQNIEHFNDTLINPAFDYTNTRSFPTPVKEEDVLKVKLRFANVNDILNTCVMKHVREVRITMNL